MAMDVDLQALAQARRELDAAESDVQSARVAVECLALAVRIRTLDEQPGETVAERVKALGPNEATQQLRLAYVLDGDVPYQTALRHLYACERAQRRAQTDLECAKDTRREIERLTTQALAEGLSSRPGLEARYAK